MKTLSSLPFLFSLALAVSPVLLAYRGNTVPQEPKPAAAQDPKPAEKKPPSEKEAKVRELLDATRASQMGKAAMQQMLEQFRKMPNLRKGFIDKFQEIANPDDLVEMIVPIYDKNVDAKDLDAVLAFMKSDVGQRWVAAQQTILEESSAVGMKWGQDLAARVLKELDK